MGKMVRHLLRPFLGKRTYQNYFESLHRLALTGMHYGCGSDTESSGERAALEHVIASLDRNTIPPYVLFDVGANRGEYARLLMEMFGDKGAVHSFEPSYSTFAALKENLGAQARLFNIGFGECDGVCVLHSDTEHSGLASLYDRNLKHLSISLDRKEEVVIMTLDKFCASEGIRHIHLLKLDVEGHELRVLEGARAMLQAKAITHIQFEFGGCNIDSETHFRDLYELLTPQYRLFRIVKDGLHAISAYRELDEIFTTINYIAELLPAFRHD
jgi:FkbM family methyltransferase